MSIYEKLYDWQKKLIDKYKDRESFGIWLDMGLGKTPISLAFSEVNNCTKIIIITINSKALETRHENGSFLNWLDKSNINYNYHTKNFKMPSNLTSNDVLIINYESLFERKKSKENEKKQSKVELKESIKLFLDTCENHNLAIIVDESHKMKNINSIQTLAINKIKNLALHKCKKVYSYLLTGTPFTQGYIDLYSQLKFLGYETTKTSFKDAFCITGNVHGLLGYQQPIVGYKNIDGLFNIIHRYAITIKSEEVVDLPDSIFVNHSIPMSKDFELFTNEYFTGKEINKELKKRKLPTEKRFDVDKKMPNPFYRNIDYPNEVYLAETSGNFWLRARQLSIGFQGNADEATWFDKSRLNKLKDFLEYNPDNYLLFYNFTPELLEIYEICEELGYNIDVYCGEVKSEYFYNKYQSQNKQERFNNKKNILLANFASGSTGKNWQLYNKCIIFSTPLYKDYEQGIKRIHRLGQKETVIYHKFYQQNWLDYSMQKSLNENSEYNLKMFESDSKNVEQLMNNLNFEAQN